MELVNADTVIFSNNYPENLNASLSARMPEYSLKYNDHNVYSRHKRSAC